MQAQDPDGRAIVIGTAPVERDGSFFIQVPGDKPIRFALLDKNGAVLARSGDGSGLDAAHSAIAWDATPDPSARSENRVPAVLLRTTTPADLTGAGNRPQGGK